MDNLREYLERKYLNNRDGKYSLKDIADEVIILNTENSNYIDVTGFAKDFYLAPFLTQDEKRMFYERLKERGFFKQLSSNLYSDKFPICSWTIYIIGKFSNNENAVYLEAAYETYFKKNPILSYRCLNELGWLSSIKTDQYLTSLKSDKSIVSKLILLYYWEIKSSNPEFKNLLSDKELINFIAPGQTLVNCEDEICSRLFSFENHLTEIYNSTLLESIDKDKFEIIARNYFEAYSNVVDEDAEKEHTEFLKQFGDM